MIKKTYEVDEVDEVLVSFLLSLNFNWSEVVSGAAPQTPGSWGTLGAPVAVGAVAGLAAAKKRHRNALAKGAVARRSRR